MFAFLVLLGLLRLIYVLRGVHKRQNDPFNGVFRRDKNVKTLIVIGSGGHTAEMTTLMSKLSSSYFPRHYIIAQTDVMSEDKVRTVEKDHGDKEKPHYIHRVPRSREVGQSYLTSVLTTIYSILYSIPLMLRIRPDLVLTNGPGTSVPLCLVAFMLKVLWINDVRIVFVESLCRVETLSLTGKILQIFADHLLVQWPQLQVKFPRTKYIGRVV